MNMSGNTNANTLSLRCPYEGANTIPWRGVRHLHVAVEAVAIAVSQLVCTQMAVCTCQYMNAR
jgi:hypothetical protein